MNKIEKLDSAYYRVKLPQILADSTLACMIYTSICWQPYPISPRTLLIANKLKKLQMHWIS